VPDDPIRSCLAFFRSVIQSGEKWSEHCDLAWDAAMAALDDGTANGDVVEAGQTQALAQAINDMLPAIVADVINANDQDKTADDGPEGFLSADDHDAWDMLAGALTQKLRALGYKR
jgi:hypothetical protein